MLILGLLGMCFDAVKVFVTKSSLLFSFWIHFSTDKYDYEKCIYQAVVS